MAKTTSHTPRQSTRLPRHLTPDQAFAACPESAFKVSKKRKPELSYEIISQERAVRAINMGLGIRKPGYNIYLAGIQGTGKTSVMRSFLEKWSADSPPPNDIVYVYNFITTETPKAISLPAGEGRKLKKRMETLVKNLRQEIPAALQSEDYENAVNAYVSAANERKSRMFSDLEKRAKTFDFQVKSTRFGIETIPIIDGRPLTEKEYGKLENPIREQIEEKRSVLEPEILDFVRKVRAIEIESKEYVEKLRSDLGEQVVGTQVDPVIEAFKKDDQVIAYLKEVRANILENMLDFVDGDDPREGAPAEDPVLAEMAERERFVRFSVNVFVDNTNTKGAPVVIETNPTYYNLFGRIEKNVEHGMYLTDFTMIKAGAVHKANGGYLVLNALDIFRTTGSIWETLKRVLKNRLGFIEDMGEQFSLLPTSGLRPEPIPLDMKVIIIGNDEIYHMLHEGDEEFPKIFKIKADFDSRMPRNDENMNAYLSFIETRATVEKLLPFDKSGAGAIVEHSSRLVEDQRYLSTQFGSIKDLTIEADYVAREVGAKKIGRDHVLMALDQKYYRVNLVEEQILESIKTGEYLLTVDGNRVGQVNGLAVYDLGDYSFGKVSRVTCTVAASKAGIINIERASKMSGRIHDKGVFILNGLLTSILGREHAIGLSASICFEQSYGMIDGDSASVTEAIAILSAMGDFPIKQNLAMTGSLNQFGEVQPIGGANEKIEGFFNACRLIGKSPTYSVLIPHQNATNLMLHREVVAAVKKGTLKIFPIKTLAEAFEIATGVPLGTFDAKSHSYTKGSALETVAKRLDEQRLREKHDKAPEKKIEKSAKKSSPKSK